MYRLNLYLFGEGTGGEGTATSQGDQNSGSTLRNTGDLSKVVYGRQDTQDAAETQPEVTVTSNTLEDKRKAYNDLIRGEYKDFYAEDTQKMINRRFKETKNLQDRVDKAQPLLDMLQQRYGTKDGDIDGLMKAIDEDNAYWQSAADEAGMEVDQYKKFKTLERQNAALLKAQQDAAEQNRVQEQVGRWVQEAETLSQKYPGFDLQAEMANDQFRRLLQAGTPVEHAYRVIHMDELMNAAAAATEKAVVDNIKARGTRPQENGVAAQSGFVAKTDVAKLSREDRREIARRVARGEMISF